MKIQKIQALDSKLSSSIGQNPAINSKSPDFKSVLDGLKNFINKDQIDIKTIEAQFSNAKSFNPKELLSFQYRISNQHVRVELVGKVVESVLATSKRMQQVQ